MNPHPAPNRLKLAQEVLQIESAALIALAERLNQTFLAAVEAILSSQGRLVVCGIGKSGHVARKIAATLASTGTPAFFVHPAEAAHGDLGMITAQDIVLLLSNSGETNEIIALLPALKRQGNGLIAMTGRADSTLAKQADIWLDSHASKEACPLGLAPTSSTTVQMALGDALAVTLMQARGFNPEDFALSHPGGSLGRKLLVYVRDVMKSGADLSYVTPGTSLKEALLEMSRKRLGMVIIANEQQDILGIYTDGDLRRTLEQWNDLQNLSIAQVMHAQPLCIQADKLATEAVWMMEQHKITSLIVVDTANKLLGSVHMHDLLQAGVA